MATVRGKDDVKRFMAQLSGQIEEKLLRGAARAAIGVVKAEASDRVASDIVRDALTIPPAKVTPGRIEVKLTVKGRWPGSIANWLEYGTGPHIIRASEGARAGRSVGRLNRQAKEGALVINGQFVGEVIHHPGARPHPFLRVSLDIKGAEAIATAQSYINTRVKPGGIVGGDEESDDA